MGPRHCCPRPAPCLGGQENLFAFAPPNGEMQGRARWVNHCPAEPCSDAPHQKLLVGLVTLHLSRSHYSLLSFSLFLDLCSISLDHSLTSLASFVIQFFFFSSLSQDLLSSTAFDTMAFSCLSLSNILSVMASLRFSL